MIGLLECKCISSIPTKCMGTLTWFWTIHCTLAFSSYSSAGIAMFIHILSTRRCIDVQIAVDRQTSIFLNFKCALTIPEKKVIRAYFSTVWAKTENCNFFSRTLKKRCLNFFLLSKKKTFTITLLIWKN